MPLLYCSISPEEIFKSYEEILFSNGQKLTYLVSTTKNIDTKYANSAIGFAVNIRDLLRSGPDEFSQLTGMEYINNIQSHEMIIKQLK